MPGPLAGQGGKPILSEEDAKRHFVGRVVIELYESPGIQSDAHGLVMSVNPALNTASSQSELLKRIAAALPIRVAEMGDMEERRREYVKKIGGTTTK